MVRLWSAFQSRRLREEGASLVEYAVLVALVVLVTIVAVRVLGDTVSENIADIAVDR